MNFLDIIYPVKCPLCHEITLPRGRLSHKECIKKLIKVGEVFCLKCGKPMETEDAGKPYCKRCLKKKHEFICGRSAYLYHGALENVIKQLKYHDKKCYAKFLAKITYDELKDYLEIIEPDFLVPVPVHFLRKMKRGYNQANEISVELSKLSGIKTINLLKRIRYTKPQNKLKNEQRLLNLKSSIVVNDKCLFDIEQKLDKQKIRVMIVDDIYTTGTTINACANAFKCVGVDEVYFITVATGN